jgi:hypothetical protein
MAPDLRSYRDADVAQNRTSTHLNPIYEPDRRRRVLPQDASMGLTPHKAAKEVSLCIRSGLSPAVTSSAELYF